MTGQFECLIWKRSGNNIIPTGLLSCLNNVSNTWSQRLSRFKVRTSVSLMFEMGGGDNSKF